MSRGKKICPECKIENGARILKCSCGHIFLIGKRKEIPIQRAELKEGRGKKSCPECKTVNGVRTLKCTKCGHEFQKKIKSVKEVSPEKRELLKEIQNYPVPKFKKMSPLEHAKRILNYGKKRASLLLQFAKIGKRWSHVDWDEVEAGL